ncbi:unnamed protein product [Ectocarpus sp. 8 AP-2014]
MVPYPAANHSYHIIPPTRSILKYRQCLSVMITFSRNLRTMHFALPNSRDEIHHPMDRLLPCLLDHFESLAWEPPASSFSSWRCLCSFVSPSKHAGSPGPA